MKFQEESISNLAKVFSGYAFKKNDFNDIGIPVIKISNVKENVVMTDCQFVNNSFLSLDSKYHVKRNDVLISLTGSHLTQPNSVVGRIAKYRENYTSLLNQRVGKFLIKEHSKCDLSYLYFYLTQSDVRRHIAQLAHGAANQANVSPSQIESVKIKVPPLEDQIRIASILSAYDDLIENNTRRIQILEQMAQTIYKEWFVNFRFPGYENTKFVDSPLGRIPEGWESKTIEGISTYLIDGDWIETKDQGGNDYRLLQISNIGINRFIETNNYRFISAETFKRLNCTEILEGDILIARMPTPIGRGWLVHKLQWKIITAVDVAILRPNLAIIDKYYLINFINSQFNLERSQNHSSGTTRPRMTKRDFAAFTLLVPEIQLQERFNKVIDPIYYEMNVLGIKNQNLRRTRDLLLPKLMSGEVEV